MIKNYFMMFLKIFSIFLMLYINKVASLLDGIPVNPGDTSFEVYIQLNETKICGGAMLNETTAVTLASCIDEGMLEEYLLVAGTWADYETVQDNYFQITSVIYHPTEDLCVINSDRSMILWDYSSPGTIYYQAWVMGMEGAVSGWGSTTYPEITYPPWLPFINIWVMDPKDCYLGDDPTRFCMSLLEGRGVCTGDGGDTVYTGQTGTLELIGLLTSHLPCGQENLPTIAYNLTYYKPWFLDLNIIRPF